MDKFPEIPGYEIEKKLGESRLTMVFQGIQEDLDRVVVVKVLNPVLMQDEAFAQRFMKEARNAINVVHPNIANILEAGKSGDIYYIVVENLPESLRDKINRQFEINGGQSGQMEIERGSADFTMDAESKTGEGLEGLRLLDVLKQLVWALEYAHKNGSTHRNIRPENIRFREDGTPVLMDLFVSNVVGHNYREALKAKGITFGSVYYESPEQALKKPADSKSDVYSLGVVLYEMLTGQVPYNAEEPVAVANQHIMEPVPQLPNHLKIYQPLLDRMMAKEKEARISAGIELVQLIDEVIRQLPAGSISQQTTPKIPAGQTIPPPLPGEEEPAEPLEPPEPMEPRKPMRPMADSIDNEEGKLKSIINKIDFSGILSNPRMLISIVGVIVIIVVLVVVVKPFSSGDTGSNQAQVEKKSLTKEELQMRERQFKYKLGLAKSLLDKGQIEKAVEKLKEAETFITTPKSKQSLEDMRQKVLEQKDDQAFKKAASVGTISAVEDYLKRYPSGPHVKEANEALNRLKEEQKQKEAERQRILAAMTKLRSQYKDLSVKDVKEMLKKCGFFEKYYNKFGDFKNLFQVKTINQGKIVVDYATGLIWHQFGSESYMNMERVKPWFADLNKQKYAGFSDWRLPTLEEVASLLENHESKYGLFIDEVFASEQRFIWTGDRFGKDKGWIIDFYSGDVSNVPLTTMVYVRPVRTMKEFIP